MSARLVPFAVAFVAFTLTGCCHIKTPAGTLGQFLNPEWAKDRISADVCYRFPKCKFDTPEQEQQFKEVMSEINKAGASLRPALRKGEITAEDFVGYELLLEFYSAQLLAWCEGSTTSLADPAKTLLMAYADRAGFRQDVDRVTAASRDGRLGAMSAGVRSMHSKVGSQLR
jgi:hypothetical protein